MAAEAVLKIKEAEEKANEMIKNANEEAKKTIKKAQNDAIAKQKAIIDEANKAKTEIIEAAVKKANKDCSELIFSGDKEKEKIFNPSKSKLDSAVKLAIERIVNANGNS